MNRLKKNTFSGLVGWTRSLNKRTYFITEIAVQ